MKHLLLLVALIPLCAFAQTRFNRLYDYNDNDIQTAFTILEQSDAGYLVGMKTKGAEYSDNKILLFRLNAWGDVMWQNEIYKEGFIYYMDYGSMLRLPDGNYLLGGSIKDLLTDLNNTYLIKIDTSGNVLWEKIYGNSDKNDFFGNFALTPDSTHIQVCGQTRRTDASGNIWLFKTDLEGEVVWDKEIPASGWQNGNYMAMLADESFLLASHYGTSDLTQYKAYKFDASGNMMWQKKVGTNFDDDGFPKIVALPDGSALFTGAVGTADWRVHHAYAVKLSPSGDIVWEKIYHTGFSTTTFARPVVLEDGSAILSGGLDYDTLSSPRYTRFWKINTEGDMLWEQIHYYNPNGGSNYIYHQTDASDGGVVGVGFSHEPSATKQDAWVLKLDSEGCLVEDCTVSAGEPEQAPAVGSMVFAPNPGSGFTTVRYALEGGSQQAVFMLVDVLGRQVLSRPLPSDAGNNEIHLDLQVLPVGAYIGTIAVDGKVQVVSKLVVVR